MAEPFHSPAGRACSERRRRDRSRPVGDLDGGGRRRALRRRRECVRVWWGVGVGGAGPGPWGGAAMAVGVVIALMQALTQIQEMTLTFVPKIIAVFVAASLTASFVGAKFSIFTQSIYARIEQGYK